MFSVGLHKVHDICWKVDGTGGGGHHTMQISQIQKDRYFYFHVQNLDLIHTWSMKIETKREVIREEEALRKG